VNDFTGEKLVSISDDDVGGEAYTNAYVVYLERELAAARAECDSVRGVLDELKWARAKFPTWPTDPLHALAVLGEEFGELTKAVVEHTYEPRKATVQDVAKEAIQTAAMAVRFVMSLDIYEYAGCEQHQQQAAAAAGGGE
jgi:hypothetical protein